MSITASLACIVYNTLTLFTQKFSKELKLLLVVSLQTEMEPLNINKYLAFTNGEHLLSLSDL